MNLDELQSVQSRERQTDSLQQLRESFYRDAGEFIEQLRRERDRAAERAEDPWNAPEVSRLNDDIDTAEGTVEAIYERRVGKVVKMASLAAADMPTEDDGLTAEERSLFETLVSAIENNRAQVEAILDGADPAAVADATGTESTADPATGGTSSDPAATGSPQANADPPADATLSEPAVTGSPQANADPSQANVDSSDSTATGSEARGPASTDVTPPERGADEPSRGPEADGPSRDSGSAQSPQDPVADRSPRDSEADEPRGTPDGATEQGGDTQGRSHPDPDEHPLGDGTVSSDPGVAGRSSDPSDRVDAADLMGGDGPTGRSQEPTPSPSESVEAVEQEQSPPTGRATSGGSGSLDANDPGPSPADGSGSPAADDAGSPPGSEEATVDRQTVRITEDVGEIFGVDERQYDLTAEDVVTLPADNVEPLVKSDAAERLE